MMISKASRRRKLQESVDHWVHGGFGRTVISWLGEIGSLGIMDVNYLAREGRQCVCELLQYATGSKGMLLCLG
jgi:hypothetical protein